VPDSFIRYGPGRNVHSHWHARCQLCEDRIHALKHRCMNVIHLGTRCKKTSSRKRNPAPHSSKKKRKKEEEIHAPEMLHALLLPFLLSTVVCAVLYCWMPLPTFDLTFARKPRNEASSKGIIIIITYPSPSSSRIVETWN